MKHLNLVVLDNSLTIREGLMAIFSKFQFITHVYPISSINELEHLMRRTTCQFIIINPYFSLSFATQLQQIRNQCEYTKWIGIVYTHFSAEVLSKLDGTIDIYDSEETIESKLLKWMETNEDETLSQNKDTLTDREIDVLKLLATGKSNKEIADTLNISINTVITHRKNISIKTGIKSVSGLTIFAVVQNLISLDNY